MSPNEEHTATRTEKEVEKLLEPSVEELEAISLQGEAGVGYGEIEKGTDEKMPSSSVPSLLDPRNTNPPCPHLNLLLRDVYVHREISLLLQRQGS